MPRTVLVRDHVIGPGLKRGYNQTNHILVQVRGSQAVIYINSIRLGQLALCLRIPSQ